MSRQLRMQLPTVINKQLTLAEHTIEVESPEWYAWLQAVETQSFRWQGEQGAMTVRRELKRGRPYWYAYHKRRGKLLKAYVGKSEELSLSKLEATASCLLFEGTQAQSCLEMRFLGHPELLRNGKPITGLTNKALCFLAYLIYRRTPQNRDHLLALFWPDSSTSAAQKNLRNLLWSIKSTLDFELIEVQGDKLCINSELFGQNSSQFCDLFSYMNTCHEEEATNNLLPEQQVPLHSLEERVRLYRGRFLEGVSFEHEVDLDLWLTIQREQFHQHFLCAVIRLIDVYREQQLWSRMIQVAQQAVAFEPCEEQLYVVQMEAWGRLGNRSAALRVYELLRNVLLREQGIEPLEETKRLRDMIARGLLGPQLSISLVQKRQLVFG